MNAAINLQPVDRVPNAPFYEAPICRYFGSSFRSALLEDQAMADAHLAALDEFKFDWIMVGMGLIGGIIPEALGSPVRYPEDVFPIIENTIIKSSYRFECNRQGQRSHRTNGTVSERDFSLEREH